MFTNCTMTFTFYKSMRKNAQCKFVDILHFDATDKEGDISKIIQAVEKIVPIVKEYKKNIFRPVITTKRTVEKRTINNPSFQEEEHFTTFLEKKEVFSIEQVIKCVYGVYMFAVPECVLSCADLFENPSIKYFIHQYYEGV